jgi:hypothetical protein
MDEDYRRDAGNLSYTEHARTRSSSDTRQKTHPATPPLPAKLSTVACTAHEAVAGRHRAAYETHAP